MKKDKKNIIWIILIVGVLLILGKGFTGAIVEPQDCTSLSQCNAMDKYFGCSWVSSEGRTFIDCGCGAGYVRNADGTDCILEGTDTGNGIACNENWVRCSNGLLYECFLGDWEYFGRCENENGFEAGVCKTTIQRPTIGEVCLEGDDNGNGDGTECTSGDWSCLGTVRRSCENGYWVNYQDCAVVDTPYSICKVVNNFAYCTLPPTCEEGEEINYQCVGDLSKHDKCENGEWVGKDVLCSNAGGVCDISTGKCDYSEAGYCKISDTQCSQVTNCKEYNLYSSLPLCEAGIYLEQRWCYDSDINDCVLKTTTTSEGYPSDEKSLCEENIITDICVGDECFPPCSKSLGESCTLDTSLPGSDDSGASNECKSGWCQDTSGVASKIGRCAKAGSGMTRTTITGKKEEVKIQGEPHPDCVKLGTVELDGNGLDLPNWATKKYYGLALWIWALIAVIGIPIIQNIAGGIGKKS